MSIEPQNNRQPRNLRVDIPHDLNLDRVYNPKYTGLQLMSTRRRPRPSNRRNPPRAPNAFFLLKNAYMLELRALGYKYTMPELCLQSKKIWQECPQEVRDRYDKIQLEVQCIHNELYPGYKFRPQKKQRFKMHVFPENKMNENINTFSTTNYLSSVNAESYSSTDYENSPVISEDSDLKMNSPEIPTSSDEYIDPMIYPQANDLDLNLAEQIYMHGYHQQGALSLSQNDEYSFVNPFYLDETFNGVCFNFNQWTDSTLDFHYYSI